ncbi:MAG TPA: CBS domain-containing protein [Terriglobales bacterium]|jgi:CBS domain-containing protein|nr:CBS domain-containing protein [Terriglobales bacterium]
MEIESISSVLNKKGHEICSVAPDATVYDALALMAAKNLAAVLVISDGNLLGIISARDYGRKVVLEGKTARDVRVQEIMTTSLVTVTPEATVLDAMSLMDRHHFRHLPVLKDGKLDGVVTMSDLMSEVISGQAFTIDQLHTYIGQPPI